MNTKKKLGLQNVSILRWKNIASNAIYAIDFREIYLEQMRYVVYGTLDRSD